MGIEDIEKRNVQLPLGKVVGDLGASDVTDKIEAMVHMDPLSAGLLTGRVTRETSPDDLTGSRFRGFKVTIRRH